MADGDLDGQDRTIVDCLRTAIDGLIAVYRFGSTVHGATTEESDIDVAVLPRVPLAPPSWFDLQEQLTSQLGREVDLLDLTSASTVLTIQVIERGRRLYDGDRTARAEFEAHALGAYARLNEERRGILERIAREGTVYGR